MTTVEATGDPSGGQLEGKRAVVTGASRGIGFAIARLLAARGVVVGMVARNEAPLQRAAREIHAIPIALDVSSRDAIPTLQSWATRELGEVDIVVNGAGSFSLAPVAETSADEFRRQLDANLIGPFQVTRAFLPHMLERRSGVIVSVGSVAGRTAYPGNGAYSAAKFGLRGLHEVLAEEIRGTGVRATLLEPAATDTSLWDSVDPDSNPSLPARSTMLRPEDAARAVWFVLSQPESVEIPFLAIRSAR